MIPLICSIITFIGTSIVAGISIYHNKLARKDSKVNSIILDLQNKKKIIEQKINEFYTPLDHQLGYSKTLFKIFSIDKPLNFRTLTFLLDPQQVYPDIGSAITLSDNDKTLLETIIKIGEKIETLIYEKSYLIGDDKEFVDVYTPSIGYEYVSNIQDMNLLSLLLSHIITIRLAFSNKLKGDKDKFQNYVFPTEINNKVKAKLLLLRQEITNLDNQINSLRK